MPAESDVMAHYDSGDWSDYVRGLIGSSKAREMDAHLAGCSTCQRVTGLLRHLVATAQVDRELEPPEHVIRRAKVLFSTPAAER